MPIPQSSASLFFSSVRPVPCPRPFAWLLLPFLTLCYGRSPFGRALGFSSVQFMLCLQPSAWFLRFSLCYAHSRLLCDSIFLCSPCYARSRPLGRSSLLFSSLSFVNSVLRPQPSAWLLSPACSVVQCPQQFACSFGPCSARSQPLGPLSSAQSVRCPQLSSWSTGQLVRCSVARWLLVRVLGGLEIRLVRWSVCRFVQ